MSGRRNNQWGWSAPETQHQQYHNQGVDHITDGISGISFQNPNYVQGGGFQDGTYGHFQDTSYSLPQEVPYPHQGSAPPQTDLYSEGANYQDARYRGNSYSYQSPNNADLNSSYNTGSRQHYSTQAHKGKSRAAEPAKIKPSRDKTRDKDYGKGKPPSSKPQRSKHGKSQVDDDDEVYQPFYGNYGKPSRGSASEPHDPLEETSDLGDVAQTGHETAEGTSEEEPIYDGSYTTDPLPITDQPGDYGEPSTLDDSSGHPLPLVDSYNEPATDNPPEMSEPYLPDDLETYGPGGDHLSEISSDIRSNGDNYTSGYEDGSGLQTPRARTPLDTMTSNFPASTVGQAELDERFIVEHSSRFYAGEVFKVLWSEPLGSGRPDMTDAETRSVMGQRFYVGIRRFIVVRTDEGHSTCVPILTYERRACTKRGVKPRVHGVIYSGREPYLLPGEPKLGCDPVKIELYVPTERIIKESRVNYSKLVTVEHNVKVFFIGRVAPRDLERVSDYVDKIWASKKKMPKDRDRRQRDYHRGQRY